MTNDISSKIDWKEVGITATVTVATAFVGCLAAVLVAQTLILPALTRAKEKKSEKVKEEKKP